MSTNQLTNISGNKSNNRSNSAKLPNNEMVSVKSTYTKQYGKYEKIKQTKKTTKADIKKDTNELPEFYPANNFPGMNFNQQF
jgi:hypothetical protein